MPLQTAAFSRQLMPFFVREAGDGAWIAESGETVVFRLTFSLRDHLRENAVQPHAADELQFSLPDPVFAHAAYRTFQIRPKRHSSRHRLTALFFPPLVESASFKFSKTFHLVIIVIIIINIKIKLYIYLPIGIFTL